MDFILKLVLLGIAVSGAASEQSTENGRIIGGHESKPYSHPYLVSLQTRLLWLRWHVCGGSILNERWVLTAAHCTKESWLIRWLPLDAVAGGHNVHTLLPQPQSQIKPVDLRLEHPLYQGGIGPHDIAVLRLERPLVFTDEIQPITLPYNNEMGNESLILAGWGVLKTTFFIPDLPEGLQEVEVTYMPHDDCRKAVEEIKESFESNPLDKDANICTGPITGGVAACSGDSGGPLIQYVPKNKMDHRAEESDNKPVELSNDEIVETVPVIRGIVSWGMAPCGNKGAPTVYTKISQYMDFINAHIKL